MVMVGLSILYVELRILSYANVVVSAEMTVLSADCKCVNVSASRCAALFSMNCLSGAAVCDDALYLRLAMQDFGRPVRLQGSD